jgi:hypothetical protein
MDFGSDVSHFVVELLAVEDSRMLLHLDLDRQRQYHHLVLIGGWGWASSMRHVLPGLV